MEGNKNVLENLIRDLKKAHAEMNNDFDLNEGGCYYAAWILAKLLERYDIPYYARKYYDTHKNIYHLSLVINDIEINSGIMYAGDTCQDCFMNSRQIHCEMKSLSPSVNDTYKPYHNRDVSKKINEIFVNYFVTFEYNL